jgi:hypothetical protein
MEYRFVGLDSYVWQYNPVESRSLQMMESYPLSWTKFRKSNQGFYTLAFLTRSTEGGQVWARGGLMS